MKKYEVSLLIQVEKTLIVEAMDEDDASEIAYEVCENEPIPVGPEDIPEIFVQNIFECDDQQELQDLE